MEGRRGKGRMGGQEEEKVREGGRERKEKRGEGRKGRGRIRGRGEERGKEIGGKGEKVIEGKKR